MVRMAGRAPQWWIRAKQLSLTLMAINAGAMNAASSGTGLPAFGPQLHRLRIVIFATTRPSGWTSYTSRSSRCGTTRRGSHGRLMQAWAAPRRPRGLRRRETFSGGRHRAAAASASAPAACGSCRRRWRTGRSRAGRPPRSGARAAGRTRRARRAAPPAHEVRAAWPPLACPRHGCCVATLPQRRDAQEALVFSCENGAWSHYLEDVATGVKRT
jgi:hypothetical protein